MNMIYENQRRSASNEPFARAFLWLLCFVTLREKCRYSEWFWSTYSRIRTEYWEIAVISPYCAGMIKSLTTKQEKEKKATWKQLESDLKGRNFVYDE